MTALINKPGVLFTMRYPDNAGYVWNTIARSRDTAGSYLLNRAACFIAHPRLTGHPTYNPTNLEPIELDCYDFSTENLCRIEQFIKTHAIKVMVFMSALPSTVNIDALHRLGVRTVNTENDSFDHRKRDPLHVRAAKYILRRILRRQVHDKHLANAESQRDFLLNYACIPPSRVSLVRNGIDCNFYQPGNTQAACRQLGLDESRFWIISVAQARPEKRLEFIIESARRVIKARPDKNVGFIYVGDGPPVADWKKLAADYGLVERFIFAGRQNDLRPYYQAARLIVHAAERESFGLAVVEAMACGLPAVACAAAGPKETIMHDKCGMIVDIDDLGGFTNAILSYVDDEARLTEHGRNARNRAIDAYSIERHGKELAAEILHLL